MGLSGWLYQAICDDGDCSEIAEIQEGEHGSNFDSRLSVVRAFQEMGWTFDDCEDGELWYCPVCAAKRNAE